MEMLHQQVQKKKEKMARLADLQRQIDEATGSFIKRACSTTMDGMMILIMIPLLLTMLLPWQQNCRLSHGPIHTSHLSFQCMMGIQIRSSF
jgi:lipopolysaccharide/colanic/teichoic acid biosynthesis glycosyltransferase